MSDALNEKFGMNPPERCPADIGVRRELLALAERDVVLVPGDDLPEASRPALKK